MWLVAPSFRGKEFLCEPYERDGKYYVKVMGAKAPREIRVYEEHQASWPESLRPRVDRNADTYIAHNYPEGRYAFVVGIRAVDGREGFWKYKKLPERVYRWQENVILSPIFGYMGMLDQPAAQELEPEFVDVRTVQVENGFKRLITDKWYQDEVKRFSKILSEYYGMEEEP